MILSIVQVGDPVLKTPAREVPPGELADGPFQYLLRDLRETLADSGGVGLAAPQVGASVRLILAGSFPSFASPDRPDVPTMALVNPRIVAHSEATEADWEGCLSIRDLRVRVVRHLEVVVEYLDPDGSPLTVEASGFFARVLQHEIDHLDGVLTVDRAASPDDVRRVGE